jgi:hypothetical protein
VKLKWLLNSMLFRMSHMLNVVLLVLEKIKSHIFHNHSSSTTYIYKLTTSNAFPSLLGDKNWWKSQCACWNTKQNGYWVTIHHTNHYADVSCWNNSDRDTSDVHRKFTPPKTNEDVLF